MSLSLHPRVLGTSLALLARGSSIVIVRSSLRQKEKEARKQKRKKKEKRKKKKKLEGANKKVEGTRMSKVSQLLCLIKGKESNGRKRGLFKF